MANGGARTMVRRAGVVLLAGGLVAGSVAASGRLHGTVETTGDATHTGFIEWGDRVFWNEVVVGGRTLAAEAPAPAERDGLRFSIFGVRLFDDDDGDLRMARFAVPFGEILSILSEGEGARIELRNGDTVNVRSLGPELGRRVGRVAVTGRAGRIEVPWSQVRRVRFSPAPAGEDPAKRLWGTATTKAGKFTGLVRWDRDEETPDDELDGRADGREFNIRFADIAAIAPEGPGAARVTLKSGGDHVLSGTNDVDERSRGLEILSPGSIRVTVEWDALERLELSPVPALPGYDRYGTGRRLRGTVRLADGTARSGRIVWDRDESYTFETLDGEADGIDWSIPFAEIASIRPAPGGTSEVRLRDGRRLTLGGSNDVDESNRGIVVESDGATTVLSVDAIAAVEFD